MLCGFGSGRTRRGGRDWIGASWRPRRRGCRTYLVIKGGDLSLAARMGEGEGEFYVGLVC